MSKQDEDFAEKLQEMVKALEELRVDAVTEWGRVSEGGRQRQSKKHEKELTTFRQELDTSKEQVEKNKAHGRSVNAHPEIGNEAEEAADCRNKQRCNHKQNEPPTTVNDGEMDGLDEYLASLDESMSPAKTLRNLSRGLGNFGLTSRCSDANGKNPSLVTRPACCGSVYLEEPNGDSTWVSRSCDIMMDYSTELVETGEESCVAVSNSAQPVVVVRFFPRTGQLSIVRGHGQRSLLEPNGVRKEWILNKEDGSLFCELFPPSSDRVVIRQENGEENTVRVSPGERVSKRLNGSYVTMNTGDALVEWVEAPFVVRYGRDRAVTVRFRDEVRTKIRMLPSDCYIITHATGIPDARDTCIIGGRGFSRAGPSAAS